ncbi:calcium-binding protein [Actinoplanes sp. DH11]|uniref:calcium-binding protein n=1 Tax=Actinoplanes sp. DH11 TaxID=2857011 RepID=UPI001E4C28A4|nr:calcium-binding protein [Actinoplanes sp. DH11]
MSAVRTRWMARLGLIALTTVGVGAFAVPGAQAASVGTVRVVWDGDVQAVQFKATTGKANKVVVSNAKYGVIVDDKHRIKPGKGCSAIKGDSTKVYCGVGEYTEKLRIHTYDRNDTIVNKTRLSLVAYAGTGNDTITGGSGGDFLYGQSGRDTLNGRGGPDYLVGNSGDDTVRGDGGGDRLFGDTGNDRLYGGAGRDALIGDQGRDKLYGGSGDDMLSGEDWGKQAADLLNGGSNTTRAGDRCSAERGDTRRGCES